MEWTVQPISGYARILFENTNAPFRDALCHGPRNWDIRTGRGAKDNITCNERPSRL